MKPRPVPRMIAERERLLADLRAFMAKPVEHRPPTAKEKAEMAADSARVRRGLGLSKDDLSKPPSARVLELPVAPPPEPFGPLEVVAVSPSKGERRGRRELGIPDRELWWIIEQRRLKGKAASRKWLSDETKGRHELAYVPRDRVSPLVTWVDGHKEAADRALALRVIPAEFRAGKLGPIPPGT